MHRAKNNSAVPAYITPDGHKRLHEELSFLWKTKRPQVTQAVGEAAAMGDRSENAEYIYGRNNWVTDNDPFSEEET
jgi:transcription elongation factor GreB